MLGAWNAEFSEIMILAEARDPQKYMCETAVGLQAQTAYKTLLRRFKLQSGAFKGWAKQL